MNLKILVVCCVVFLSACASTQQRPQQQFFPVTQADVVLPAPPADFIEEGVHVYDQPQLGYSVRYKPTSGADAHLDVYIYPLVLPEKLSLADAQEGYFMSGVKDISQTQPSAQIKTVSVLADTNANNQNAALKGTVEIGPNRSLLYLTIKDDVVIKARFTEKSTGGLEKLVDKFFLKLSQEIRFTNPASRKHPLSKTILIGSALNQEDPGKYLGYALGYMQSLLLALESGKYLNTFEREYTAVSAGLDLAEKLKDDKKKPEPTAQPEKTYPNAQIAQMLAIRKAGFLREYVWDKMRVEYWGQPADLKLEDYKTWMQSNLAEHKGLPGPPASIGWEVTNKNKATTKKAQ